MRQTKKESDLGSFLFLKYSFMMITSNIKNDKITKLNIHK